MCPFFKLCLISFPFISTRSHLILSSVSFLFCPFPSLPSFSLPSSFLCSPLPHSELATDPLNCVVFVFGAVHCAGREEGGLDVSAAWNKAEVETTRLPCSIASFFLPPLLHLHHPASGWARWRESNTPPCRCFHGILRNMIGLNENSQ